MTLIYGHRGYSGIYPENTMLAFEKAAEAGADGIEFDVHLTKDEIPVVMHDENTLRTTGFSALIRHMTLEEFKALDAGAVKNGDYGVLPPPTLREVLELAKDTGMGINIEIKSGIYEYPGIEKKVLDLLDEFELRQKSVISSFNHFTIRRMKELAPELRCGLLEESWLIGAGAYTRSQNVECFHPIFNFLNDETVKELRDNKVGINAWGIVLEEDMERALDYQLEIGITNYVGQFLEVREKRGK